MLGRPRESSPKGNVSPGRPFATALGNVDTSNLFECETRRSNYSVGDMPAFLQALGARNHMKMHFDAIPIKISWEAPPLPPFSFLAGVDIQRQPPGARDLWRCNHLAVTMIHSLEKCCRIHVLGARASKVMPTVPERFNPRRSRQTDESLHV